MIYCIHFLPFKMQCDCCLLPIAPTSFVVSLSSIDRLVACLIAVVVVVFCSLIRNQCARPASLLSARQLGRIAIVAPVHWYSLLVACYRVFDWKSLGCLTCFAFIFRCYIFSTSFCSINIKWLDDYFRFMTLMYWLRMTANQRTNPETENKREKTPAIKIDVN